MPKDYDSEGSNDDASLDDVPPAVADSEAKQQLNGELEDDVDKIDAPADHGEVEDHVDSESDSFEPGQGEFTVEEIRGHTVVKGKVLYEIKWQHYPDDENTWEPEGNLLPHSRAALAKYHDSIGGAPVLKKSKSKQNLRRQASADDSPAPSKRQKRNGTKETSTAADGEDEGTWTPGGRDWESQVDKIETVEKDESGQLVAYILFKNGRKTKVGMDKVYAHCPRPMLKFYEDHLKFN